LIKRIGVGLFVFLLLMAVPVVYYFDRIADYLENPDRLLSAFMVASKVSEFSLKFVLMSLSISLLAFLVDYLTLGWEKCALNRVFLNRSKSTAGDLWCWFLSVVNLYDLFALVFSFGIFYVLSSVIVKTFHFELLQGISSPYLQFMVLFILGDLKHYLWHRFMHNKVFWELHSYHHSATEMNLITTSRGNFLERSIFVVFDSVLFALLGAPAEFYMVFVVIREFYQYLLHSNSDWKFGLIGKYILISPYMSSPKI